MFCSTRPDAELAARGGKGDFAFGDTMPYPPVIADGFITDGQVVRVGKVQMQAVVTPGHTRGCTTWRASIQDGGVTRDVVFLCSLSAPGYRLVNNEAYPGIMDDYRRSIERLRKLDPDVFLGNHGGFFDLSAKLAGTKPFVQKGELRPYLDLAWKNLLDQRSKQKAKQRAKQRAKQSTK